MNSMVQPKVTVIVVPRERFSLLRNCLEKIEAYTSVPYRLIVMDTNSPRETAAWLKAWEKGRSHCRVVRTDSFLYPHEAKQKALGYLETEWAAFIDSDVLVGSGWLEHLLKAVEETGARVVHPLYLVEQAGEVRIHMTDGKIRWIPEDGTQRCQLVMGQVAQAAEKAKGLSRKESDFIEFHTFLIHRQVLEKMGAFEPFTLAEDVNYSLRLRELGERIIFEPRSVITYVAGPPFESYDLPYFRFRWNLKKAEASLEKLRSRWPLAKAYCDSKRMWVHYHHSRLGRSFSLRRRLNHWWGRSTSRILGGAKRLCRTA